MTETQQLPHIIIGLGNIGRTYEQTRHNAGFMVIDKLLTLYSNVTSYRLAHSHCYTLPLESGEQLTLVKPTTFMNLSGLAVGEVLERDQKSAHDLLVIVDDFALPLGTIRLRRTGSAGGHNGLESLISSLGTTQFTRLRVGIGPLPASVPVTDFVLGSFHGQEQEAVRKVVTTSAEAAIFAAVHGPVAAMDKYNKTIVNPA